MKNNWAASGFGSNVSPELVEDQFLDSEIVILLEGTNLFGDAVYSYLKLNGRNLKEMFGKMKSRQNFKPADFGTVLAAGRGKPTTEIRQEMVQTHNMIDVPDPKPTPVEAKPVFAQPKPFSFFSDDAE